MEKNKLGGVINGHDWVDMGLSVKWATCNVGATSPSDFGSYFAWGETAQKSNYSWQNYKFRISGEYDYATFNKYITSFERNKERSVQTSQFTWEKRPSNSNTPNNKQDLVDCKTRLELSDDAARANWGGTWRIPTREELEELVTKCSWELTLLEDKRCYKVTSNINGNCIFLPLSGLWTGDQFLGGIGRCWSSSLITDEPYMAFGIEFAYSHTYEDVIGWSSSLRCEGLTIRPVSD